MRCKIKSLHVYDQYPHIQHMVQRQREVKSMKYEELTMEVVRFEGEDASIYTDDITTSEEAL